MEQRWYRGNLHAHTDQSDGRLPPAAVTNWYASHGYDFLAITDHGRVTRYEPRHNSILMIPGAEVTAFDERTGAFFHLLSLFGPDEAPAVGNLEVGRPQRLIDQLLAAGALVALAHPYWLGVSSAELAALDGAVALEVYNNLCEVEKGRGYSEVHWDELLLRGKRLWGLAVDDCHWRSMDVGGGWVMVRAPELSVSAILASIRRGDFYSTQGPEIRKFALHSPEPAETDRGPASFAAGRGRSRVVLECTACRRITFYADRWLGLAVEASGKPGEPLTAAAYPLTGKETYVRAMVVDEKGRRAWTQPLFLEPPSGNAAKAGGGVG